jgi:hypothetical protein
MHYEKIILSVCCASSVAGWWRNTRSSHDYREGATAAATPRGRPWVQQGSPSRDGLDPRLLQVAPRQVYVGAGQVGSPAPARCSVGSAKLAP